MKYPSKLNGKRYAISSRLFSITTNFIDCHTTSTIPSYIESSFSFNIISDSSYEITENKIKVTNASKLFSNGVVTIYNPTGDVTVNIDSNPDYLCFTANTAGSTISLIKIGSPSWTGFYSTDRINWTSYYPGYTGVITLTNINDKIYFKGAYSNNSYIDPSNHLAFEITAGSIASSGNIMSFCSGDDFENITTIPRQYMFYGLFKRCGWYLTSTPTLPATTLTYYCYGYMFSDCTRLTTVPSLPATILNDWGWEYCGMFAGCYNLVTLPKLPATTLTSWCYANMFKNCINIKISETQTEEYPNEYTFGATPSSTYADSMFSGTGGTFTGTPTQQTYYTSNTIIE